MGKRYCANSDLMAARSVRSSLTRLKPRIALQYFETRFLQSGVVVIVDDIEADHGAAIAQQALRNMEADKAGRSSDQNRSIRHPRSVRV